MAFTANQNEDPDTWDYVWGMPEKGMSIAVSRFNYLSNINFKNPLKIALRDPSNSFWTKWVEFPGMLMDTPKDFLRYPKPLGLTAAIDVHRSMLDNEIVIESDYPTYEENYEAARLVGKIFEEKGFIPHYYYSGNKSIHIHVFFDWDALKSIDVMIQDQLKVKFKDSKLRFKRKFIEWLRTKMISCWDTQIKQFDTDLIKATHLIRCELSKNKKGYKTFLGYFHNDLSSIPYVCNESNRIYPKLGKILESSSFDLTGLIREFMEDLDSKAKALQIRKKNNRSLVDWGLKPSSESLRQCIKAILSPDFKKLGDGFQRGMFILVNDLRKVYGDSQARIIINDWNAKMDFPVKDSEIEYRFKSKSYSLSCEYVHNFLKEMNIDISKKCNHKVYKE